VDAAVAHNPDAAVRLTLPLPQLLLQVMNSMLEVLLLLLQACPCPGAMLVLLLLLSLPRHCCRCQR
jgi:hypothetical protein